MCGITLAACGGNAAESGGTGSGGNRRTQDFDMMSHLEVNFTGINSSGTAAASVIDNNTLQTALMQAAGFTVTGTIEDLALIGDFEILRQAITWSLSPDSNLSNGDQVTVTLQLNQSILSDYNVRIPTTTRQFTVSGLDEMLPFPRDFSDISDEDFALLLEAAVEHIEGVRDHQNLFTIFGLIPLSNNTVEIFPEM